MSHKNSIKIAAKWMFDRIKLNKRLDHEKAVSHIMKFFGKELVYDGERGGLAIHKSVLREFKKLHGGKVTWSRFDFIWYLED